MLLRRVPDPVVPTVVPEPDEPDVPDVPDVDVPDDDDPDPDVPDVVDGVTPEVDPELGGVDRFEAPVLPPPPHPMASASRVNNAKGPAVVPKAFARLSLVISS